MGFDMEASVNASYEEWSRLFQVAIELNSMARYHETDFQNPLDKMSRQNIRKAQAVLGRMLSLYDLIWKLDEQFAMSVDMGTDMFLQCRDIETFLMELK